MPVPVATNRTSMASALTTMLNAMETQSQRALNGHILYELWRGIATDDRGHVAGVLTRIGFTRGQSEALADTIAALPS